MAQQNDATNGSPRVPSPAEGDLFLFVRINPKTSEFQVLYSDLLSALALRTLAVEHLDHIVRGMIAPAQHIQVPGVKIPSFDELKRRSGTS